MNSNERAEIHGGIAWAMVFALAAVVMGIVAIAHKCPRFNLDFDYLGLLVGILSLLVAALLGWQVFNAIENVKTLRKMEDLERKLELQIDLSERIRQDLFDIAEAHRLEWEADRSTDLIRQYWCHLRALLLYIRSNVSLDYAPLQNKIRVLAMYMNRVKRSKDNDDKIRYANGMSGFDDLHEEILDAIGKRQQELRKIRRQVIRLKHRREDLFRQFIGQKPSMQVEQEEREAK